MWLDNMRFYFLLFIISLFIKFSIVSIIGGGKVSWKVFSLHRNVLIDFYLRNSFPNASWVKGSLLEGGITYSCGFRKKLKKLLLGTRCMSVK